MAKRKNIRKHWVPLVREKPQDRKSAGNPRLLRLTDGRIDLNEADDLIREAENSVAAQIEFGGPPRFCHSNATRKVIAIYALCSRLGQWPIEPAPKLKKLGVEFTHEVALRLTIALMNEMENWRVRFMAAPDATREIRAHREKSEWDALKARFVQLLREAADLFDAGQYDIWPGIRHPSGLVDFSPAKLREWATHGESMFVEVLFPKAKRSVFSSKAQLGKRGGASDPKGALRALLVRQIARFVPETMTNRYATIAHLAQEIGVEGISRQYVRAELLSTLEKERT